MTFSTANPLDIIRNGRRDDSEFYTLGGDGRWAKGLPRIECADGFSLSVQVGKYLYSTPREDAGPWTAVEVGFPSATPEPWSEWEPYVEDANDPTGTVYAYVPLSLVEALIESHGGAA